ncbi:M20/M25/M40 family metallo-hydrolase [Lihuaxuella thermophila]|uniref:Arginine utilization protein RocB n=1 Tax=Lihuaxuella thermophila TaxID=1173111 RepID=A0A1H8IMR1_9BACL|nr:M20/M25/M40 family metallo-hydrolase [Lihuaxuella thermophila]SEN69864.1 Arginine utilization protein RocB [Lihuaxuella thermophila]
MEKKWATKEQLTDLLCDLVRIPSITGSEAEIELAEFLVEQLRNLPYFQKHRDHLQLFPTGDGRYFVTALVKKKEQTKKTVILLSHFDVVDVEDYGVRKDMAFDARKLTDLLYTHKEELPEEVKQDLDTGNWLFGRGTMDMKAGLALHIAMVEQACEGKFDGNVLLLSVPDEEVNSAGMRAAVPVLLELAKRHHLEYKAVLNSEPMFTRYPGDPNKYIYTGSIGKILPGFLCYGKETHVGEPFSGLNANYMASLLTSELELNTDFCEVTEGETSPPPTNLLQKDLKKEYSVQIPHRAVTLFNLFLLEKSVDEVIRKLLETAETAAQRVKRSYEKQAAQFPASGCFAPPDVEIRVLTYEELMAYALTTHGQEEIERIERSVLADRRAKDDREATIELVDELAILCKELAPMIVLFFAPPYYPAVCSGTSPLIQRVVSDMISYARTRHGITLKKQNYFGGISDLSYVGLQASAESRSRLVANMPLWNRGYSIPLEELELFDVPVINLGPLGRDAHQWTERLNVDSLGTLMDLLPVCIQKLLTTE